MTRPRSELSGLSRRRFLALGSFGLPMSAGVIRAASAGPATAAAADAFPAHPPDLVREIVTVAHFNLARVREIVEARPSLARAAWDWGFGDWETALGAASHVGNRPIAEYLIEKGARPSLFSATMLGQLDVVKAFIAAQPGVQRIPGPHSIGLLAHAKAGGAQAVPVLRYLESLGDADAPPTAPLSADDMGLLTGTYVYGSGQTERVEISIDRGALMFTRMGTTPRGLRHLGDRVFHPAGAAAVRIRFAASDGGALGAPGALGTMTLTVHDPDLVITATRQRA
jgi:hypothetical protein